MRDRSDLADLLSQEIDGALAAKQQRPAESMPDEYQQVLATARELTELDFDPDGRAQRRLRSRVLAAAERPRHCQAWSLRPHRAWRYYLPFFAPVTTLALVMAVALAWPGALTAVARTWETSMQRLVLRQPLRTRILAVPQQITPVRLLLERDLGPRSVIMVQDDLPTITYSTHDEDVWEVRTAIGDFRGHVAPGQKAAVHHFATLDQTRAAVDYAIHAPAYLPSGYGFREGVVTPARAIYFVYQGPHDEIVMAQVTLRADAGANPLAALAALTDKPVMRVAVGHLPGNWIDGHGLIWENDDATLLVGGPSLSLDEATRIAISLR